MSKHWSENRCRQPFFEKARQKARRAIEKGILVRPDTCEMCGKKPPPMKNGRASIQGHHPNYDEPLNVQWLCVKCHRKVTPIGKGGGKVFFGSENPQAKLTEDDVRLMRELYKPWVFGAHRLGKMFGISKQTTLEIVKRKAWTHVE